MIDRQTIFSADRQFRYTLWRSWADDLFQNKMKEGFVMFIGLNPSTADESLDDPTIRKCAGFTKRWGYLAFCMTNLFAYRATIPRDMKAYAAPVGEENDSHLARVAAEASLIIAAWGTNGNHHGRDVAVRKLLSGIGAKLNCLRVTKDGHPEHPLYIPYETELKEMNL